MLTAHDFAFHILYVHNSGSCWRASDINNMLNVFEGSRKFNDVAQRLIAAPIR